MAKAKAPAAKREKIVVETDVIEFTDKNFAAEIDCDEAVLVDFTASWCGPCQAIAPVIEALATAHRGKLKVGKLDIDKHPKATDKFGVKAVPTLLLFKNGSVVSAIVGAASKSKIEATVKNHLKG